MIRKTISFLAIASFLMMASCKKEAVADEVQKVETSADGTANATQAPDPNAKYATMDFDRTEHDFGHIKQGDKVETVFTFTNNGEADLVITSAKGSCGCTVPEYPKTPVKPGEQATLKVSFNSTGKKGLTKKTIRVQANTKSGVEKLIITADIEADPNQKAEARKADTEPLKPVINKQTLK